MPKRIQLCFLRGAPGVGKSTAGRLIAERLGNTAVVEVDQFRGMLGDCDWHDRSQHEIGMQAALAATRSFLASGISMVIYIDTFGRDRLPRTHEKVNALKIKHITFALWANPSALGDRLSRRIGGYQDFQQADWINEEIRSVRYPNEQLLDTTAIDAETVVEAIIELLSIGQPTEAELPCAPDSPI